jgi:hypothetical protein
LPCPDLTSDEPHQSQCQSRPQPALQHRRPHRRRHCERERCFRVSSSAACEGMTYERQCIPFSNAKAWRNARVRPARGDDKNKTSRTVSLETVLQRLRRTAAAALVSTQGPLRSASAERLEQ